MAELTVKTKHIFPWSILFRDSYHTLKVNSLYQTNVENSACIPNIKLLMINYTPTSQAIQFLNFHSEGDMAVK